MVGGGGEGAGGEKTDNRDAEVAEDGSEPGHHDVEDDAGRAGTVGEVGGEGVIVQVMRVGGGREVSDAEEVVVGDGWGGVGGPWEEERGLYVAVGEVERELCRGKDVALAVEGDNRDFHFHGLIESFNLWYVCAHYLTHKFRLLLCYTFSLVLVPISHFLILTCSCLLTGG